MDIIHRGLADIIDRQAQKINELQAKLDKAVEALKYFDEVLRIRKSFKIEELEYKAITTLTEILEL